MVELVRDVVYQILQRLPVKSLIRFKCVSKRWRSLVSSNPRFIRAHLETMAAVEDYSDFVLFDYVSGPYHARVLTNAIFHYDDHDHHHHDHQEIQVRELHQPNFDFRHSWNPTKFLVLIGQCHGLLCMATQCANANLYLLMLWNPSMKELKQMPSPKSWEASSWRVLGFGFDCVKRDYKIVMVPGKDVASSEHGEYSDYLQVLNLTNYSVATIHERNNKKISYFGKIRQQSTFARGCLYWFASKTPVPSLKSDVILCFDLATYNLSELSPPLRSEDIERSSLTLFHDNLCVLTHNKVIGDNDLWIMDKETNGVHKSWVKLITIPEMPNDHGRIWWPFPVCLVRNDGVLVSADNRNLFVFNLSDETFEKLDVRDVTYWAKVIPYVESLVSPYRVCKVGPKSLFYQSGKRI